MNSKRHLYAKFIVLLSLMLVIGYGCGGGGGSDGAVNDSPTNPPQQSSNIFYSSPTDARVMTVADPKDGSTYTYNGEIDSDGQLSKLTSVVVKDPEIEGDLVYILDDDGNPSAIHTPESTFELERLSDSEIRLTAIADDGELRVSMPLEVAADSGVSASQIPAEIYSSQAVERAVADDTAVMQVNLTKCGQAVENALITMDLFPPIGTSRPVGTHMGGGRYNLNFPATVDPKLDLLKKCGGIAKKIGEYCLYASFINTDQIKSCDELADSVANIPFVGGKAKQKITDYCQPALLKHLPKIKSILCEGETAEEIENVCRWEIIRAEPEETHNFSLSIKIPGGSGLTTEPLAVSPNQSYVWDLEAPTDIALEKLYIVPANPANTEWFTAHAAMVCPDPDNGTDVTLSVTGSDGHTGANGNRITTNSTISLDIPGASDPEKSIRDTITVSAEGRTWTMVVHRGPNQSSVETQKYVLFKRSGTGYRGNWGGFADKHTGYDYFYKVILPSEIAATLADANKFDEFTAGACQNLPVNCPCPSYPDIWETGQVELVGSFDTAEEMDPYRCDPGPYDPSKVICSQWVVDRDPKYYDNIDTICR
jgi:hypothetical protein